MKRFFVLTAMVLLLSGVGNSPEAKACRGFCGGGFHNSLGGFPPPIPFRSRTVIRKGGLRGLLLGRVFKQNVQTPFGFRRTVARQGGLLGLLFGRSFREISGFF